MWVLGLVGEEVFFNLQGFFFFFYLLCFGLDIPIHFLQVHTNPGLAWSFWVQIAEP